MVLLSEDGGIVGEARDIQLLVPSADVVVVKWLTVHVADLALQAVVIFFYGHQQPWFQKPGVREIDRLQRNTLTHQLAPNSNVQTNTVVPRPPSTVAAWRA